jgi:3',5'-cyclic AMP phosphodiesterase CpdA
MRAAWATDVHLEFVEEEPYEEFLAALKDTGANCVLLTGDIGQADSTCDHLRRIADALDRPVYFVLGNHDFYGGSIAGVREATERCCEAPAHLHWLSSVGVVGFLPDTALIGHDGWADGRLGDYANSDVELNDYFVIDDFKGLDKRGRLDLLHRLGDEAAEYFRRVLPEALARYRRVVALTHVPPFREACWHEGRLSNGNWLPHFTCKAAGDAMAEVMRAHPDRELLVLCGHTHGAGEAQVLPNLRVLTGGATYGAPVVERVLEWG